MSQKKKIFVISPPASGHVNPVCGLISELSKHQDVEVIAYNDEEFKDLLEKSGAKVRLYSKRSFSIFPSLLVKNQAITDTLKMMIDHSITFTNYLLPELLRDFKKDQPDFILYDNSFMPGRYLVDVIKNHHKRGKLKVKLPDTAMFAPNFAFTDTEMKEMTKDFRLTFWNLIFIIFTLIRLIALSLKFDIFSLDIIKNFMKVKNDELNLIGVVPELQPNRDGLDQTYKFVGPFIAEQSRSSEVKIDDKIKTLLYQFNEHGIKNESNSNLKLIYVSLGSVLYKFTFIYELVFEAARDFNLKQNRHFSASQLRFIISVGESLSFFNDKVARGELQIPDNVLLCSYAPQLEILKKADLFITHCGMNSTNETIKYAVPIVAVPVVNDQPMVAKRVCDELSLGIRVDLNTLTSERIGDAIDEVLSNQKYKNNIDEFSKVSNKYNGSVIGAKIILDILNQENKDKKNI